MTPQQFLLILWARRKLILIVLPITVIITLIVSLLMPKRYEASVSLVVDVKPDPIAGSMISPTFMMTQTDIIQSDRVAMRAVKLLHLDQSPPAIEMWNKSDSRKVPFDYYYGNLLRKALVVAPFKGSNVISITYAGQDPGFTAAVANAFAQAYIDTNIELRVDPARQYTAWFDERQKSLRVELEKAQARLSAYQQQHGIVASDERVDQESAKLVALTTQLSQIQAQKVELNSRQKNANNELSPEVQGNALIQGFKSELSKAETSLKEISRNVGKNHPSRLQLESQIESLKQQMQQEIERISGGTATASRNTAQMEQEIQALIEVQKKKVLDLREEHDQINVMNNDVLAAQRAYDNVAQRTSQLSLESKSEQSNLSILSPAMPATEPSRPNVLKNVLASIGGGLALGIAIAIGLEFLDRRVRNAADLKVAEGVPLLGVLAPEPKNYTARQRVSLAIRYMKESWRAGRTGNTGGSRWWRWMMPWRKSSPAAGMVGQ